MRHQLARAALAAALALCGVGTISGCSEDPDDAATPPAVVRPDVPPDVVARVGDTVITNQRARGLLPGAAKDAESRQLAVRFLVVAEWIRREAKREGISAPEPAPAEQGQSETDPIFAEVAALTESLREKAGGGPPSKEEVARYYERYPNEYARPEVRFMRLVAADSQAQAAAAKRALERGQRWKSVIARYTAKTGSPSPLSGDMGLQPGEGHEALGRAVYAAERDRFYGPVRTDQAWYVFELTSVDRRARQSFDEVRETIGARLQTSRDDRAARTLRTRLRARYRHITVCDKRLLLPLCSNGPALDVDEAWSLAL
jgi:hypothetical protein